MCEVIRDPASHMGLPVAVDPAEIVHCDLGLTDVQRSHLERQSHAEMLVMLMG